MKGMMISTPIGKLTLLSDGESLTGLQFGEYDCEACELPVLKTAAAQLDEYFRGERREFDIALRADGTPFQKRVWAAMREIPYGETRTYGCLAARAGNPKAARAAGGASHNNPIAIIIPCHRVVGANGSLTGFGGGLDVKEWLLRLEGAI